MVRPSTPHGGRELSLTKNRFHNQDGGNGMSSEWSRKRRSLKQYLVNRRSVLKGGLAAGAALAVPEGARRWRRRGIRCISSAGNKPADRRRECRDIQNAQRRERELRPG